MKSLLSIKDYAQEYLRPYLLETQELMELLLHEIDSDATCRITPAPDLGIPHDVIRIAGGFATGCLVEWSCSTPVVPIDTTVNIDTTSIFYLDADVVERFTPDFFSTLRNKIEADSSYEWNFHKGNHFISAVVRLSDGTPCLAFHSNEKEFKYQYNGLMPTPGNWFMNSIITREYKGRYIRLLAGHKAVLFCRIAKMLEEYNILRHRLLADIIVDGVATITGESHNQHYFMPDQQSVAIGCYLCDPGDVVPILSRPGRPIDMFRPSQGGPNHINLLNGDKKLLVPHGWGKTSIVPFNAVIENNNYIANGISFPLEPKSSLGRHNQYVLRDFSDDPSSCNSLYSCMRSACPGSVIDRLIQHAWYNKDGVARR